MPAFIYHARDPAGQPVRGRAEADSTQEVVARLRHQGFLVLEVERDRDLQTMLSDQRGLWVRRINGMELAVLVRQFATMTNAGLPVVTALKVLARQSSNQRLQNLFVHVAHDVESGESLAAAFSRHSNVFPAFMVHMIAAGEVGGILDETLARMAQQLEKDEVLRQKVRSAMIYPAIVSTVAVLVVVFLVVFVAPSFVEVYADMAVELPLATRLLIAVSNGVKDYWWLVAGITVGVTVTVRYWLRTDKGATFRDKLLLTLPIFGPFLAKQAIARFARTLSGLLASGVTILKALAVVERVVGNRVIAASIRAGLDEVRQGQNLMRSLGRSAIFPPIVLEMISIGEETGTLEEMLAKVADFYDDEVYRTAERLSASLEPVIIVGLALTVGFIVTSMMMPVFNLWSAF